MGKKFTEKMDDKLDKKAGIKDGSAKDKKLDKARGLPVDAGKTKSKKRPPQKL